MKVRKNYFIIGGIAILAVLLVSMMINAQTPGDYSPLAREFLLDAQTLDAKFPPDGWNKDNLRNAALEVLDAFEAGVQDSWVVPYCLLALGHVKNPDDVSRILAYEDVSPDDVLSALRGFPAPTAIEYLLRWADSDEPERELAYIGLGEIDFSQMDESVEWHDTVVAKLQEFRTNEDISWMRDLIDDALQKIYNRDNGIINDDSDSSGYHPIGD
jgi:hypothetical protein